MGSQRLFVGTPVPPETARKISDYRIPTAVDAVRWVKPENYHVTLQFLGDTDDTLVPSIVSILAGLPCPDVVPLTLSGAGAFPTTRRPRVLWIGGAPGDSDELGLAAVHELLGRGLKSIGIELDTRFTPHVTVAYSRKNARPERLREVTRNFIENTQSLRLDCTVPSLALFSSSLTPEGAVYRVLYSR